MPLLCLHIRSMNKYTSVLVEVRDTDNKKFILGLTNMQSNTVVQANECVAPLVLKEGWNMLSVDLADIVHRAFGVKYSKTICVQVSATCRLWHLFFQDQAYADAELPPYVRVL